MSTTEMEKKARRLCRHTVCYTDALTRTIAMRAMQGFTTKAIAAELGITQSRVQYAILKAQHSLGNNIKFRHDYRNATSPLAKQMIAATEAFASREVRTKLAAKFARLAAPGVPRV